MAVPEQLVQHSLRIGDVIFLHSRDGKGYMFSESSSSDHLTLSVLPVLSPHDPNIPDLRMAAFKVVAPNKNKAQERLAKLKKKQGRRSDSSAEERTQLMLAERNSKVELKNNELEQERQSGTPVLYGSVIQLLHMYSKKYVTISTVQTSKTESTNMQMHLLSHDSESCLFRILPRYKVRSVGDEVRMEDQVTFASEKTEGQYIHTSGRKYSHVGIVLHENCSEINASATESGYTVKAHYQALPTDNEESVKGGSIIRLFHRELECYLVAEGSFANSRENVVVEDVHLRKRKSEHGKLKAPSTSAITYWQIEKEKEPLSGQVISWAERCRIKHLPTRMYLAIIKKDDGTFDVRLKERELGSSKDLDTVFRLFPVIEEDTGINLESYTRINHPHTKTWLVAKKGQRYDRRAFDPNASGLAGLQWDSAELKQIGVSKQMSYDDAFTIDEIDPELIKKFTYAAGIVPVIQAYIKEKTSAPDKAIGVRKARSVKKALDELSDFMKYAHPRMKDHQKLLRNLMILEQIVMTLKLYDRNRPTADVNSQRIVCQACYGVIEVYLVGQSRKNENYLARFITFFEEQIGLGLNAENMLIELVRDNSFIVSKFGEREIDNIIKQLLDSKDSRFFDYLGVLCVCDDRPIPETQDAIIDKLVRKHGKDLFYLTEIGGGDLVPDGDPDKIYYRSPSDPSGTWRSLHQIAATDKSIETSEYQFLVSQLDLFGKLCKGNNESAVEIIDVEYNYLTFEEALVGAQDKKLHSSLRSKYVELIVVLYVDVGNNRAILDNLSLSFIYTKVVENPYKSAAADSTKALTGEKNKHFPELRDWIKLHVSDNQSVVGSKVMIDINNFNTQVLDLLYLLVKYGYYADLQDINDLVRPLLSLLNGMNDLPFPEASDDQSVHFRETGRYEDTHDNRAVFNLKIKALRVMDLFFNFRFYLRLQHFIYDYKLLKGDVNPDDKVEEESDDDDDDDDGKGHQSGRRFLGRLAPSALTSGITSGITQQVTNVTHQVTQVTHQLTDIAGLLTRASDEHPPPPVELKELQKSSQHLVRITDHPSPTDSEKAPKIHGNEELMMLATDRLRIIFSFTAYEFETHSGGVVSFPDILLDLSKYHSNDLLHDSLHLLARFYSAEETLFEKAIQAQLLITKESVIIYEEITDLLPRLRHLAFIDVNDEQCQELVTILERLTTMCHLEGDTEEPHGQNQKILYNTGVFTDVLNLVFREKSSRQISSDGQVESIANVDMESDNMLQKELILSKCLLFLKRLARNNITVQERLFDRMDDLLQLDVAIVEMADVLTEIFTGGKEICLKIKETQVEQIFHLIANGEISGRPELLGMLQAVVKVEELDLPLKRNQAYIIKYFSKTREKFCNDLLGLEDEKVKRRKDLLLKANESDIKLQTLLRLVDLLASCSEGENLFIESICQNIISIYELLDVLSIHELSPTRKKPYARFLLWVYMNTGGDKFQAGSTLLFHDLNMWQYLEHLSFVLDGTVMALSGISVDQTTLTRHNFKARSTRIHKESSSHRRRTRTMSRHADIPFVTDKEGEIVPGILVYIMDGILPMLRVFYAEYFLPHDSSTNTIGDSSERADPTKEILVSAAIASGLLNLADIIEKYLSSKEQWDLLRSAIITILNHGCFEDDMFTTLKPGVREKFDARVATNIDSESSTIKGYQELYAQEIKLNKDFNNFARNFELAYWGPNSAKIQIGSPYNIVYSEFDEDLLEERGDEWLPLGPSFQSHLRHYAIRHKHETKVEAVAERIIDCLASSYNNLASIDEKERQRQDKNDIRYLQLLRTIIHNEIMFVDPDLREEGQDPAMFRKLSVRIESVQTQIQILGDKNSVERLVKLLSHPNDNIAAEVLAFLAIILYNGNSTVQEGFSYLMNTREEKLFVSMQLRLQQAGVNDRERRTLLAQLEARVQSQKTMKDTYVTRSTHHAPPKPTAKEVFDAAYIDGGIDAMPKSPKSPQKSVSIDAGEVSQHAKLIVSGDAYEMQPLGEYGETLRHGRMSITDPTMPRRRKKRLDQMTEAELLAEAGVAETEIQLQKLQDRFDKTNTSSDKSDALKFKDTSFIDLALRVLGLLCDGQYRPMQNYLREQPDNIKTINLVSETCSFLQTFYVEVTKDNIVLITGVLQTMIEMSVGNFANQQVLFNHQIVDTVNRILQTTRVERCSLVEVLELKLKAIELVEAMCEETHPRTEYLVQSIFKALDIDAVHSTLAYFYKLSQDRTMKEMEKDDDAERAAFRAYHLLVHMADFEGISLEEVGPPKPSSVKNSLEAKRNEEIKEAWTYCSKQSKSVELFFENEDKQKTLAKVHFRFHSSDELPEEIIEKVKYRVQRDSPEDKARDFLEWMISVQKEITHLTRLRQRWYTNMFIYNIKLRNYLLILWTLVMNIMLVIAWSDNSIKREFTYESMTDVALDGFCVNAVCYGIPTSNSSFTTSDCDPDTCMEATVIPSVPSDDDSHWFFNYALYIGGGIHLLMSLAMVISYFLINWSNFVLPDVFYKYILRKDRTSTYSDESLLGLRSIYHIVFVACSALSLPFYGYFYCVCLLHIVIDNDILQRVLKSVTKNGRSLLWVTALGLVIIFIYSVGTFAFLANDFHDPDPEEDGENVRFCRTLIQCYISVLEYGLLDTLGLTADLPMKFKDAALRAVFFDLTFFIIVTTIGLNIVFGIIVDTFSELRDERYRIEEDKKGYCFICGIPNYDFERRSKGFDHHVKYEHNMWDYIYFYLHLERIDVSDHNAIESYAYHQIKNNETDFFPLFKARSLKVPEDETLTQLSELRGMITEIMERFHREEKDAALRRKREEQAQWEKENIGDVE